MAKYTGASGDVIKSKTTFQQSPSGESITCILSYIVIVCSVAEVEAELKGFHRRFNAIKELTIKCLEKCQIAVMTVVYLLTSIRAVGEHKVFLEEKHPTLRRSEDHWELFGLLNLYWNYLAYDLLDQLIEELTQKNDIFKAVAGEMAEYKKDLQIFRQHTTLELFCQVQPEDRDEDPPPGFKKMVVKHNWPEIVTLEDVERFRQRYARKYNLSECAMMLHNIRTGSITVTWFIPDTVVEILRAKRAVDMYTEFKVTELEIAGTCVYQTHSEGQVSFWVSRKSA